MVLLLIDMLQTYVWINKNFETTFINVVTSEHSAYDCNGLETQSSLHGKGIALNLCSQDQGDREK